MLASFPIAMINPYHFNYCLALFTFNMEKGCSRTQIALSNHELFHESQDFTFEGIKSNPGHCCNAD